MTASAVELVKKRCSKCGEVKLASEFSRHRRARDGLQSQCKPCNAAGVRAAKAKRRAELGEEAFLALEREAVARFRAKSGGAYQRRYNRVYHQAVKALIEAHSKEFEGLLRHAKYEAGFPVE